MSNKAFVPPTMVKSTRVPLDTLIKFAHDSAHGEEEQQAVLRATGLQLAQERRARGLPTEIIATEDEETDDAAA